MLDEEKKKKRRRRRKKRKRTKLGDEFAWSERSGSDPLHKLVLLVLLVAAIMSLSFSLGIIPVVDSQSSEVKYVLLQSV